MSANEVASSANDNTTSAGASLGLYTLLIGGLQSKGESALIRRHS
eukprot:gene13645-18110_t